MGSQTEARPRSSLILRARIATTIGTSPAILNSPKLRSVGPHGALGPSASRQAQRVARFLPGMLEIFGAELAKRDAPAILELALTLTAAQRLSRDSIRSALAQAGHKRNLGDRHWRSASAFGRRGSPPWLCCANRTTTSSNSPRSFRFSGLLETDASVITGHGSHPVVRQITSGASGLCARHEPFGPYPRCLAGAAPA